MHYRTTSNIDIRKTFDVSPAHHEFELQLQNAQTYQEWVYKFEMFLEPAGHRTLSIEGGYWNEGSVRIDDPDTDEQEAKSVLPPGAVRR